MLSNENVAWYPVDRACMASLFQLRLSVGVTCHPYLLETEGLFTQGWRPGRSFGEPVGGILETDSSDWSNGIRYDTVDTRSDTEFNETVLLVVYRHTHTYSPHPPLWPQPARHPQLNCQPTQLW